MNRIQTLGILAFLTLTSTVLSQVIDETKIVDLTYSFDEKTIYWPTAKPFHWQKDTWKITPGGYWYAAADFAASEHGGTHLDSPIHFGKGKATTDQIPLTRLIGPAIVIDITGASAKERDYRLTVKDITAWEKKYGRSRRWHRTDSHGLGEILARPHTLPWK